MLVSAALGILMLQASRREVISARFFQIVSARAYSFSVFLYSFCFLMGLLGKYRVAIFLLLGIGMAMIDSMTELELKRFGPIALVDERLAFERDEFPLQALGVTLGMTVAFVVLTIVLVQLREGTAAAMLAERMSHREKVFVSAFLLGLIFLGTLYDQKRTKQPFAMADALVEESELAAVQLARGSMDEESGRRLVKFVHDELAAVSEYLDLEWSPPVFVSTRRDLDPNRYEVGTLTESEGLLVRVNPGTGFDESRFVEWLVREYLIVTSRGRAKLEPRMWVLDGFGPFWVRRKQMGSNLLDDRTMTMRALYGSASGSVDRDCANWLRFREQVGHDIAVGVAWSGLNALARRQGERQCQAFLRSVLGRRVPDNVRAWFQERRNPPGLLLQRHAAVSWPEFLNDWQSELDAARREVSEAVMRLPRLTGELTFQPLTSDTLVVKYRVAMEPAAAIHSRVALVYAEIGAFNQELQPQDWQREEFDFTLEPQGELPGTRARGERIISTFSLDLKELGCTVISGWKRQEIR
jgi:hypothetical protein